MKNYDYNIAPGEGFRRRSSRGHSAPLLLLAFFAMSSFLSVLAFLTALIALCR